MRIRAMKTTIVLALHHHKGSFVVAQIPSLAFPAGKIRDFGHGNKIPFHIFIQKRAVMFRIGPLRVFGLEAKHAVLLDENFRIVPASGGHHAVC